MPMMRIQKNILQPIARVATRMNPLASPVSPQSVHVWAFQGPYIINNCIAYLHTQGTEALHMPDHRMTAHQSKTQVGIALPANCQT